MDLSRNPLTRFRCTVSTMVAPMTSDDNVCWLEGFVEIVSQSMPFIENHAMRIFDSFSQIPSQTPMRGLRRSSRPLPVVQLPVVLLSIFLFSIAVPEPLGAEDSVPTLQPLVRIVDLKIGETAQVELCDGALATVTLLNVTEHRDSVRGAVRRTEVDVEVNHTRVQLGAANYDLPTTIAGVQIDCSITKGTVGNSRRNVWGLNQDARLRLWPAGSPLTQPGTFVYPLKQRWFAGDTQMANEPTFVNGGEKPERKKIYYHDGLDFGGSEGLVEVVSATDAMVVSAGRRTAAGDGESPRRSAYDSVYTVDGRGWSLGYVHLQSIDPAIRPGVRVRKGQTIGILGKEGSSGGWSHLHLSSRTKQQAGRQVTLSAYAFIWDAYVREYHPKLKAVARPHHLLWAGETVTLDATKSWSAEGKIAHYAWSMHDRAKATGAKVEMTYPAAGTYSEVVKVSDANGNADYDFVVVQVLDPHDRERLPPTINPNYFPTFGIHPGAPVTFKVRVFRTVGGPVHWDFGDGSPSVAVRAGGSSEDHAADGYVLTKHTYQQPGHYVVTASHTNEHGLAAVGHLQVRVNTSSTQR